MGLEWILPLQKQVTTFEETVGLRDCSADCGADGPGIYPQELQVVTLGQSNWAHSYVDFGPMGCKDESVGKIQRKQSVAVNCLSVVTTPDNVKVPTDEFWSSMAMTIERLTGSGSPSAHSSSYDHY